MYKNIAIIGGSGALGRAFTTYLAQTYSEASIYVFSRSKPQIDDDHIMQAIANASSSDILGTGFDDSGSD